MSKANVSKRYAEALFQLGQEKSTLEQLEAQLLIVKEVFEHNSEFYAYLKHPKVSKDNKKQLIADAFKDFSTDVVNLLNLLVDRKKVDAVMSIADDFSSFVNEANGIAEAKVYSIRELNTDEKKQLIDVFAEKLNKKTIKVENIVDPSLLGGVKLKIGNTIYDGSVKGKLERIERNIVTANKG